MTIREVWPQAVSSIDRVAIEICLRNIGKEPFFIPSSNDYSDTLTAGHQDRRTLGVRLQLRAQKQSKIVDIPIGGAAGSSSVANSMITLLPQETLVIRAAGRISETQKWHDLGLDTFTATVQVVVSENFLETDRFVIMNRSEDVKSDNGVEIVWRRQSN